MIYGLHWVTEAASKCGRLFTCSIYEPSYVSAVVPIPAGNKPFEQNILASSDDPFDPILASELKVNLDITGMTDVPDMTTRNDRKYLVKLTARDFADDTTCKILFKMYETSLPVFLDSNLIIQVNGVTQVAQYSNGSGSLIVNTGDTILIRNDNYVTTTNPSSSGWKLQVQKDGSDIYNTVNTVAAVGTELSYSFVAGNQNIYEVLCCTYQIGDNSQVPPTTNSYLVFQGFILSDATRLSFTTGRIFLDLTVSDGLAMLKNIPYVPSNRDINTLETLQTVVQNCLNSIGVLAYNWNSCLSIFATGMANRGASTNNETLAQTYYAVRNWVNAYEAPLPGITPASPYKMCYDVLSAICLSFGCQIKQHLGEYWIAPVNDQANTSIYFTKYDQTGTLVSSGSLSLGHNVIPYDGTDSCFFTDNSQAKVIRKGYTELQMKCATAYSPNMIDNGDMTVLSSGFPVGWPGNGIGAITYTSLGNYNAINLAPTGGGALQRTPSISATSIAPMYAGDKMSLSFMIDGQATVSTTPKVWVQIVVTTPSAVNWFLDNTKNWVQQTMVVPITNVIIIGTTTSTFETVSIDAPPCPVSGTMHVSFICDNIGTLTCTVANVILKYISPYQYRIVKNDRTDLSYRKIVDIPMGGPSDYYAPNQIGTLSNSSGVNLSGWYRYGRTESYTDLLGLLWQQYFNIESKTSVNIEGNIWGLLPSGNLVGALTKFTFTDTTIVLPMTGKSNLIGNARINYTENEIQGTLLDVSDTDITDTVYDRCITHQI